MKTGQTWVLSNQKLEFNPGAIWQNYIQQILLVQYHSYLIIDLISIIIRVVNKQSSSYKLIDGQ